jgi:hypothetical protein
VAFIPDDFEPPRGLVSDRFLLEPLGPEHDQDDHEAWSSSIEHIRATPGFRDGRWPRTMTLDENRADLERHARDFAARSGRSTARRRDGRTARCVLMRAKPRMLIHPAVACDIATGSIRVQEEPP